MKWLTDRLTNPGTRELRRFGFGFSVAEIGVAIWLGCTRGAPLFDLEERTSSLVVLIGGLAAVSTAFALWAPRGNLRPYQLWTLVTWPIVRLLGTR